MCDCRHEIIHLHKIVKFLAMVALFTGLTCAVLIVTGFTLEKSYTRTIKGSYSRGYEAGKKSAQQATADAHVVDCMGHLMDDDQTLHALRAAHPECEQVYLDHQAELEVALGESL